MGSTQDPSKLNTKDEHKQEEQDTKKSSKSKVSEAISLADTTRGGGNGGGRDGGNGDGGGGRLRHDSNSSCDSARSPSTDRMKRRRTKSLSSSPLSSFFFPPPANPPCPPSPPFLSSSPSSTFVSPGGGSGGPQSPLLLDDVISAVNGVTNMALAHEIALDRHFKLEKFEPPHSSIEKQVRDVMHQAFWDNLREQLARQPPVYTQAFVLLQEVRQQLLELTLPHQLRLRQQITDKLDLELITQQAEHHVLNFSEYSGYVVELMGKLCAPVRDEAIRNLRQQSDPVEVFRGVAETLDLMKLDMANYTIQLIRPTIVKHIVEYERGKFKEFLATQKDGLELTRNWILQHVDKMLLDLTSSTVAPPTSSPVPPTSSPVPPTSSPDTPTSSPDTPSSSPAPPTSNTVPPTSSTTTPSSNPTPPISSLTTPTSSTAPPTSSLTTPTSSTAPPTSSTTTPAGILADPLALRNVCNSALNCAYMQLLQWPQDQLLPETVCVDMERVLELRDRLHQVCLLAAVLLVSLNTATHARPSLAASHDALRAELKRDLCPILDPAYTREETLAALPNLTEQVVASLQKFLERNNKPPLEGAVTSALRHQLTELQAPQHRVSALVTARCIAFFRQILCNSNARNVAVPAPFVVLQEEVARICGGFLRFTQHNRAVFGEYYFDMAEDRLKTYLAPAAPAAGAPAPAAEAPAPAGQEERDVERPKMALRMQGEEEKKGQKEKRKQEEKREEEEKMPVVSWDSLDLD